MPLEVPLFYRIALAILFVFLFVFPYEGWLLFFSRSVKNCVEILKGGCIESKNCFLLC